jgi:hypothetical protein
VDEAPKQPCKGPGEPEAAQVSNRSRAPDGSHRTIIPVPEHGRCDGPLNAMSDEIADKLALLLGNRRYAWQRFAVRPRGSRGIADDEDVWMSGEPRR